MSLPRLIRPFVSALLIVVITLATMLTSAQSARAASPITIWMYCEGLGGGPRYSNFACNASPTGGTGSYSYSWSGSGGVLWFNFLDTGSMTGGCRNGVRSQVTLTVTDSVGNTGSASNYFVCYEIVP
ncbi:MAG TPA: hypothetical protein VFS21_14185 [Roseiflexaceae bacterium]|nr:hypothetical protein [Roseiflexaceae bacterium]